MQASSSTFTTRRRAQCVRRSALRPGERRLERWELEILQLRVQHLTHGREVVLGYRGGKDDDAADTPGVRDDDHEGGFRRAEPARYGAGRA